MKTTKYYKVTPIQQDLLLKHISGVVREINK
jgi:hypothetical protein